MNVTVNNVVYKFCTAFSDSMYYVFFHNTLYLYIDKKKGLNLCFQATLKPKWE